ncbi:MAG: hypothetical protein HYV42_05530 [Candidatus Magasanikbacteria bacterium]|nr:hypothetical protein [Candidatus Magasanikbacteria bacterium]
MNLLAELLKLSRISLGGGDRLQYQSGGRVILRRPDGSEIVIADALIAPKEFDEFIAGLERGGQLTAEPCEGGGVACYRMLWRGNSVGW